MSEDITHPVTEERERLMFCLDGGRDVNHLYEMCRYLKTILHEQYPAGLTLVTSEDKGGRMYSLLYHCLRSGLKEGFPMWRVTSSESARLLETGPLFITGDSCHIPYSHTEFLANMGDAGGIRLKEGRSTGCLFVFIRLHVLRGSPVKKRQNLFL